MAEAHYELVVIGAGPGGYVAAIRAAQLGLEVACVEKRATLGGTCLNIGCIPSKALLHSSEKYEEALRGLKQHGVVIDKASLDLPALMSRKTKVVDGLTKGIELLFKKNGVAWIKGAAKLAGGGRVQVALNGSGEQTLVAERILIATGSDVAELKGVPIDEKRIVSSTGALALDKVPEHLIVIGGGYIGLEMGSVWRRLGSKVTVVEFLDRIVPGMDGELARQLQRVLGRQGMTFKLSTKVTGATVAGEKVKATLEPVAGGAAETLEADIVLVSTGRRPYADGLGLAEAGVALDEKGRIRTDSHFQTNVPGIYAIGDVIAGPMLAHKAEEEGVAVAELMVGQAGHVNYETVPGVVYTWPEVATVGKTEEELKAAGVEYRVGKFPFTANSRARCTGDADGFVKILADARTDRVLGGHILGPDAGHLIHEIVMAMEFGASAEDVARAFHAHPTLNEAIKEAALAAAGRAIHI
jgi:dihydrolipoamide dehydrogenase